MFKTFFVVFVFSLSTLRIVVMIVGSFCKDRSVFYQKLPERKYTILVPMFMENVRDIDEIRKNIKNINYSDYEVLFLCEEEDDIAYDYFKTNHLSCKEKYVMLPKSPPFTKPKACNYGLEMASGEFLTIYDVEDKPHFLQQQIALNEFDKGMDCVQFRLEFVYSGTIISAWQCIDYYVWYQCLIPFLKKINAPIPLGGTSNHFRVSKLREIGGWDEYNVTEDADLGIKMFVSGCNVTYIDRYQTKERTVNNVSNLLKQRTRWAKGHLLTVIRYINFFRYKSKNNNFLSRHLLNFRNAFWICFILGSNFVLYTSYVFLTVYLGNEYNDIVWIFIIIGVALLLLMPVFLLISIPNLRRWHFIIPMLLIYLYYFLYLIPIIRSIFGCIFKPHAWYKTKR